MNRFKSTTFYNLLYTLLLMIFTLGCTADRPLTATHTRTSLGSVEFEQAFSACHSAMRAEFGRVKPDREEKIIVAEPEYFTSDKPGLAGKQLRRYAQLKLVSGKDQIWAYLQIRDERLDTGTYQQFQPQRTGEDYHKATPMESGESIPWSKRQVWSPLKRLYGREKRVLQQIRQQLGLPNDKK